MKKWRWKNFFQKIDLKSEKKVLKVESKEFANNW